MQRSNKHELDSTGGAESDPLSNGNRRKNVATDIVHGIAGAVVSCLSEFD